MRRRKPKNYPPGTFLPKQQRIFAILQLCISFSLILWTVAQPFMGEYFDLRSRMILYEYAMGTSDILKKRGEEIKLEKQKERFAQLPDSEKNFILNDYQHLQNYAQRPVYTKILDGIKFFILGIPAFEIAWLFFSIVIAILLLLKVTGAKEAVWILPLLTLAYTIDNRLDGLPEKKAPDYLLFPSEQLIIQKYTHEPLGSDLSLQRDQLRAGWNRYLVENWLPLKYQDHDFEAQVDQAEFQFTLARLQRWHGYPMQMTISTFREKVGTFQLVAFMTWNLLLAWIMNRKERLRLINC